MIYQLANNRVRRAYLGGARIDQLVDGQRGENTLYPEDWLASTVEACNYGYQTPGEGLGKTVDGQLISKLVPQGLSILVKLLDAADRLVIQAHPTRAFAREHWHSPVGKMESWYMLQTDPDASVYIGFRENATRAKWADCFQRQDTEGMLAMLHHFSVKQGDCILVPGGVPHAIGGGCLMVETQEPSDLMVIPERRTPAGLVLKDEKMHGGLGFDTMLDCFVYDALTPEEAHKRFFMQPVKLDACGERLLSACDNGVFSVLRFTVTAKQVYRHRLEEDFAIVVVVEGEGCLRAGVEHVDVHRGDRFLLMQPGDLQIEAADAGLSVVFSLPAQGMKD